MKKLVIMLVAALVSLTAAAEDNYFTAALSFDLSRPSNGGGAYKFGPGVGVGLNYTAFLTGGLFAQPGVKFYYHTSKANVPDIVTAIEGSVSLRKIGVDIPIVVGYQHSFTDNVAVKFFTGPMFDIGITNKFHWSQDIGGTKVTGNMDTYDSKNPIFKRFDVAWEIGAGVLISNFVIGVRGDIGLLDISKINDVKVRQNAIEISLGYAF